MAASGSSPRARGTHCRDEGRILGHGLIPASAGNSGTLTLTYNTGAGSSPRARGTLQVGAGLGLRVGLIPASAGNSSQQSRQNAKHWAHPRERGELGDMNAPAGVPVGSSPRARGTLAYAGRANQADRLIPASAGNSRSFRALSSCLRAHPRERGELILSHECCIVQQGSSPRARGTHSRL